MASQHDEFDYVVVGAGAAGCVVTNRLVNAGNHTVCLLEAGPADNSIILHVPAGVYKASTSPNYAWQFETEASVGTANRKIQMPQGKTLGGSTAINGMNYNRGNPADFDDWARRGNRGWDYAHVLAYFKRSERRLADCDTRYRGTTGELPITDNDWPHPMCDAFIDAAEGLGLPRNPDYNGASQAGVGYYQRYINKGWRFSAARAFLRPLRGRQNLDIRTRAQATSLLFEGKRVVGVRYAEGPGQPTREVKARREVIVCSGATNTPKLLQISGVGPAKLLADLGVPVVHNLPGVGSNLQDHYMVHLVIRAKGIETINGHGLALLREGAKWMLGLPSLLAISPSLVYGFANSRDMCSTPDIQLDFALGNYSSSPLERFPVMKLGFYQLRPKSVGYVRAASADPFSPPLIQPSYLSNEADRRVVIDGVRTLRRLFTTPQLAPYFGGEILPGPAATEDMELLDFAREAGLTAYHPSCTCKMGPASDPGTVVGDDLKVHGLDGLRIADASIMPTLPSANTSAAVFMIGEKASDMILGRVALPSEGCPPVARSVQGDASAGAA